MAKQLTLTTLFKHQSPALCIGSPPPPTLATGITDTVMKGIAAPGQSPPPPADACQSPSPPRSSPGTDEISQPAVARAAAEGCQPPATLPAPSDGRDNVQVKVVLRPPTREPCLQSCLSFVNTLPSQTSTWHALWSVCTNRMRLWHD